MTRDRHTIQLVLYIKGAVQSSERALRNLRRAVGKRDYIEIAVRDVDIEPLTAADAPIVITPTLVLHWPPPRRIVIGELDDLDRVRALFELAPR